MVAKVDSSEIYAPTRKLAGMTAAVTAIFILAAALTIIARGYSATRINLRLKREEIGSYLGLKLETVSRVLSRFQEDRLIRLNRMINHRDTHPRASRRAVHAAAAAPARVQPGLAKIIGRPPARGHVTPDLVS